MFIGIEWMEMITTFFVYFNSSEGFLWYKVLKRIEYLPLLPWFEAISIERKNEN